MSDPKKPMAFDVDEVELTDDIIDHLDGQIDRPASPRRGIRWTTIFFTALGLLLSLAVGLAIDGLIRGLFERYEWLGWFGLVLTSLIVVAALAIIVREIMALRRLRKIDTLRQKATNAFNTDNKKAAEEVESTLISLYEARADTAADRACLLQHKEEIIDGRDRIKLAERDLLKPLDNRANDLIMNAAKRVAIVTAVSPRALVDIIYVLAENIRLVRAISDLYGGRPGALGFIRLTRSVLSHLAVTGAISVGDGLLEQVIGHGLAARISARFGEGVVNGLLTARIGLACHDICRPIPFLSMKRPGISNYMNALIGIGVKKDAK